VEGTKLAEIKSNPILMRKEEGMMSNVIQEKTNDEVIVEKQD
jgi:hypothetical protein